MATVEAGNVIATHPSGYWSPVTRHALSLDRNQAVGPNRDRESRAVSGVIGRVIELHPALCM